MWLVSARGCICDGSDMVPNAVGEGSEVAVAGAGAWMGVAKGRLRFSSRDLAVSSTMASRAAVALISSKASSAIWCSIPVGRPMVVAMLSPTLLWCSSSGVTGKRVPLGLTGVRLLTFGSDLSVWLWNDCSGLGIGRRCWPVTPVAAERLVIAAGALFWRNTVAS